MKWQPFLFLFFFALQALASSPEEDFFRRSMRTNEFGMYVLGSWAMANIATGAFGLTRTQGSTKHFHQMNLAWNVVNLGIAGFALWNFSQTDISNTPFQQLEDEHLRAKRLYIINAGIDVLYMAAGAYMWHRSSKAAKRPDILKGFGQSIVLQGGFLLVFDAAMFLFQQHNERLFPGVIKTTIAF